MDNIDIVHSIHEHLCTHVPWAKVMERVHTINEQLKRTVDSLPMDTQPKNSEWFCDVCNNKDERNSITDEHLGCVICIGTDGLGCGNIMHEYMLKGPVYYDMTEDTGMNELFSPQYTTSSQWCNGSSMYKRLNMQVERDLVKYNRDDTLTSDLYKDHQRRDVYALLDEVHIHLNIDTLYIDRVKVLFHDYRTKIYRVHKLEIALTALFYIVLCQ